MVTITAILNLINKNSWWITAGIFGVGVTAGIMAFFGGSFFEWLYASISIIVVCGVCSQFRDRRVSMIVLFAFMLRFGLVLVHRYVTSLPDSYGDAIFFDQLAWKFAQSIGSGEHLLSQYGIAHRYSGFIGILYFIFGHFVIIPQLINAFLGAVVVWASGELAYLLSHSIRAKYIALVAAALFPTMNLYSAIVLREYIMLAPVACSLVLFIHWMQQGKNRYAYGAIILSFVAPLFHSGMLFLPVSYALFFAFYRPHEKKFRVAPQWKTSLVFVLMVLVFLPTMPKNNGGDMGIGLPGFQVSGNSTEQGSVALSGVAGVNQHLDEYTNRGRAVYLQHLRPDSVLDMVIQTPLRSIYFLFTPTPWQIMTATDAFGAIDALMYLFMFVAGSYAIVVIARRDRWVAAALVLIVMLFIGMFAWGVSNYGAAVRHRQKMAFAFIAIASVAGVARPTFSRTSEPSKQ